MGCGSGSVCRLCRREGLKLFLKGDRCFSEKCAIERRSYPPGQHGQRRVKFSEYGLQLREKQKVRRLYGMGEKQFALFVDRAEKQKGATGDNLIVLLERRLDSVIYLLGFVNSRAQARQLIGHSHFLVNGKKVKTPSYLTKIGDVIEIREASCDLQPVVAGLENAKRREIPGWLELDVENKKGRVKILPVREDVKTPIEDHFIVEYYSR